MTFKDSSNSSVTAGADNTAKELKRQCRASQAKGYCIDIVKLEKSFRRHSISTGYTSLKSCLLSFFKDPFGRDRKPKYSKTLAIRDLTLRILPGQAAGIIGRNGSGKSTLLKLVTGIYKPDKGTISVKGRLAALIELGAGFHPDFSGRENVYLAAAMFGMARKEIDRCFNQIVEFSELQDVIDDPVRTYSSGMFMRLGFSVAVHTNPDVLLIDEVLAVGDAKFVVKCKEKLNELKRNGKTFLFVSHDLPAVERWCDEVIWLHEGEVKDRGEPRRVIDHYREFIEKGEEADLSQQQLKQEETIQPEIRTESSLRQTEEDEAEQFKRWGSKEIEILKVRLTDSAGSEHLVFHPEDSFRIDISYKFNDSALLTGESIVFGIGIHRSDGLVIHGSNTEIENIKFTATKAEGVISYQIERLGLLDGRYRLDVAVHRQDGYPFDYHQAALKFSVRSPLPQIGVIVPRHQWIVDGKSVA